MYEGVGKASWREALQERLVDGLRVGGKHKGVDRLHKALVEDFGHRPVIQGYRPTLGACNQRKADIKDPFQPINSDQS